MWFYFPSSSTALISCKHSDDTHKTSFPRINTLIADPQICYHPLNKPLPTKRRSQGVCLFCPSKQSLFGLFLSSTPQRELSTW